MGQGLCHSDQEVFKGEPRETAIYTGECDSLGRPDGKGTMLYKDGSKFEGTLHKGYPANGNFFYPKGDKYVGELDKCRPHGKGIWK